MVQDTPSQSCFAIVGVGLIGGSIAAALKRRGLAERIVGVGRNVERLQGALDSGLIDEAADDLAAVGSADLTVFCTPVDRIVEGVREAALHTRPGAIFTDAGSIKGAICGELAGGLPAGTTFVGSHPLAGSEKQGFEHADAELFIDRVCVITPDESSPREAVERVSQFWESLGMQVVSMSPAEHDSRLAITSHVPHVVAAAVASQLSESDRLLAATGFRDTTRIAAGDPELWTAILTANASAVGSGLQSVIDRLARFRDALSAGDAQTVLSLFRDAKGKRQVLD